VTRSSVSPETDDAIRGAAQGRQEHTETKELIAGFWMIQVKSKREVIEWVKRCPNPLAGEAEIEIRQVFEASDFPAEILPPEDTAREQALREELQGKAATS
jgi:hypothetical protein